MILDIKGKYNKKMPIEKVFTNIIKYCFYLLFLVTPLLFTPVTYELFEFNKMYFVYFLTGVISFCWLGKMIITKKFKLCTTSLDLGILFYLASSLVSTINSIHPHTSIWGYYSRFHGGLLSIICYIVLYYAYLTNMKGRTKKMLKILLFSAFLVAGYGILEHFGIDEGYWVQDVRGRVFSTLGQPNWLGAFIVSLIFLPLGRIIRSRSGRNFGSWSGGILYLLFLMVLIFTNSKSAILAFWVCLLVFLGLMIWKNKKLAKPVLIILLATIFIYGLFGGKTYTYIKKLPDWIEIFSQQSIFTATPGLQSYRNPGVSVERSVKYAPRVSESSEIRRVVWKGALRIFRKYPLFGSGVETFAYAYYQFRPIEHNLLSEWDYLYNKAHNEFLNILACQGIFGLLSYLLIIGLFLFYAIRVIKKSPISQYLNILISLLFGFLGLLITNFFGFSVVMTGLLFWFIPAFVFDITEGGKFFKKDLGRFSSLILVPFAGISLYFMVSVPRLWLADYHFNKGEEYYGQNYLLSALTSLQRAVSLNSREALYHSYLAKTTAKMAVAYADEKDKETVQKLENLAVTEAKLTLLLNPVHLNFHKSKAEVYLYLSQLDEKYASDAIEAIKTATKLAPTDAKLLYNIGLLYNQQEKLDKALEYYKKAVELKPNYTRIYFKMAEIYKEQGELGQAEKQYDFVLNFIDPDNKHALEELEKLGD